LSKLFGTILHGKISAVMWHFTSM